MEPNLRHEVAVFAGGCFWCMEAVFSLFQGIVEIIPGYSGGCSPDPSYEEVCNGDTGHAEAIKITFDPTKISYDQLLEIFFSSHDPTQLNRQGADIGTQYRSAIFFNTPLQQTKAKAYIQKLEESNVFEDPIVTEIEPLEKFYNAEKYHHQYFEKHPDKAYCQISIKPKVEKIHQKYKL